MNRSALLEAFVSPEKTAALELARQLGRAARGRRDAGHGEQPVPEMFGECSAEIRVWRDEYGSEGRKWLHPLRQVAGSVASGVAPQSPASETFALRAEKPNTTPTKAVASIGTKTTQGRSAKAANDETPLGEDHVAEFVAIGVSEADARAAVNAKWELDALRCQVAKPPEVSESVWSALKSGFRQKQMDSFL